MSITTTAAGYAGELVAAEIVSRMVIDAAYAQSVMPPLVRVADISGESTLTVEFPKWPRLTASDLTEGTDMTNTGVDTTSVSCTADEAGIMITVTDVLAGSAITGGLAPFAAELGKAMANKIDTDLLAEVADFTTSVGTSGADMTEQNFLDAIYALENGNATGPFACVLHPIQVADLRKSIITSGGQVWGSPSAPSQDIGSLGALYGIDIFQTTNCASVTTDANRQGVMMPIGNQSGLAFVVKMGAKAELERDASRRATEIVVTAIYGDENVNTAANGGVAIITDHE